MPSTNRGRAQIGEYIRQYLDNDIIHIWYSDLGYIKCYFVLSNMALWNWISKAEKNSNSSFKLRANRLILQVQSLKICTNMYRNDCINLCASTNCMTLLRLMRNKVIIRFNKFHCILSPVIYSSFFEMSYCAFLKIA